MDSNSKVKLGITVCYQEMLGVLHSLSVWFKLRGLITCHATSILAVCYAISTSGTVFAREAWFTLALPHHWVTDRVPVTDTGLVTTLPILILWARCKQYLPSSYHLHMNRLTVVKKVKSCNTTSKLTVLTADTMSVDIIDYWKCKLIVMTHDKMSVVVYEHEHCPDSDTMSVDIVTSYLH